MNCSYTCNGIINCLENFTTSDEINNFDSDGYTQLQDTANLVGYILNSDLYSNSDKNVQIMAFIDDKIRSRKTKSTDIRKVPVNNMIDEELHNKHVFYMTIFGDSNKDTDKKVIIKIKYNNKFYELSSDKELLFRKNNRFNSNLLTPVRFTVLANDQEDTQNNNIIDEPQIELEPSIQRDLEPVAEPSVEIVKKEEKKEDELTDELKSCLSSFLECNEDSNIMQAKCLDDFLQCNKDGTLDQCTKEFVSCNKI